ncbi:hypothetical protein EDD15DRAFT_2198370 [Pisolithus albus]|nr:hypothetical protein EDD15DRAFT_2198370 [Pisolithus albus]
MESLDKVMEASMDRHITPLQDLWWWQERTASTHFAGFLHGQPVASKVLECPPLAFHMSSTPTPPCSSKAASVMSNSSPIRGDANSTIQTVRVIVDHPHSKIQNLELDSRYASSGHGLALAICDGEQHVLDTLNASPNPTNNVLEHEMITSEPYYNQGNSTLCVIVMPNKDYESCIQKCLDETTSPPAPAKLTHARIHLSVDTVVELMRTWYQYVELEMSSMKDGVAGANDIVYRFVSKKHQAQGVSPPSSIILTILCGTSNTHIRKRGNAAAHTASGADIRWAIMHFSKDWPIMEEIYFIKGADIIFNVCGSVVNMEKSFHDVKKAAQILLDNTIIQGYEVSSAAFFALHDSAMLGRHSNIVLIFWKSGDIVVEKLVWTDKNIRPWGNYLPVQCPQCGTMQKWVGGGVCK